MNQLSDIGLIGRGDMYIFVTKDADGLPSPLAFTYMDLDRHYFILSYSSLSTKNKPKRDRGVNRTILTMPEFTKFTPHNHFSCLQVKIMLWNKYTTRKVSMKSTAIIQPRKPPVIVSVRSIQSNSTPLCRH